jgi:hypothetical protein
MGPGFVCVHSIIHRLYTPLLMRSSEARALRCRPVRETPIYEQLRGERINAEVPPGEAASPPVGRSGRHRRRAETTGPVAVCAPPEPGADLRACQHRVLGMADQPPGAAQRTAALWGPRAPLPHPAPTQQTREHAAASGRADLRLVGRPREVQHTDCPPAMPEGQFSWFDADCDIQLPT